MWVWEDGRGWWMAHEPSYGPAEMWLIGPAPAVRIAGYKDIPCLAALVVGEDGGVEVWDWMDWEWDRREVDLGRTAEYVRIVLDRAPWRALLMPLSLSDREALEGEV